MVTRSRGIAGTVSDLFLALRAALWRRLLFRTTVIAITGSHGKTTAKECLAAILAAHGPTVKTLLNHNGRLDVPRTMLRVRPWRHRFAVIEVGVNAPGQLVRSSWMLRPDVVWVVSVGRSHSNNFRTVEETAREKASLLRWASRRGVAVLNADDHRVRAMAPKARGKVVLYGTTPDSDVRVGDVSSCWPDRLRFTARAGEESAPVSTQLVGNHWVVCVAGALAAAHA